MNISRVFSYSRHLVILNARLYLVYLYLCSYVLRKYCLFFSACREFLGRILVLYAIISHPFAKISLLTYHMNIKEFLRIPEDKGIVSHLNFSLTDPTENGN